MKLGTRINSTQTIPDHVQQKLWQAFPNKELSDLIIRYYDSVEDIGYDYFVNKVLPSCTHSPIVQYLEPFISFIRLGEALVLATPEGLIIYDTNGDDNCTETGPIWFVAPKSEQTT